jgi:hypothetical protein
MCRGRRNGREGGRFRSLGYELAACTTSPRRSAARDGAFFSHDPEVVQVAEIDVGFHFPNHNADFFEVAF